MRRLGDEDEYSAKGRRKLRRALLSVYYHTIAREFEIRGAPSVLLPPEIDPMSLRDALAVIAMSRPPRLIEALWRVVQSVPLLKDLDDVSRYPTALATYLNQEDLRALNHYRCAFRQNSEQFSITLMAIRNGNFDLADAVPKSDEFINKNPYRYPSENPVDFTDALREIVGYGDNQYFQNLLAPLRSEEADEEIDPSVATESAQLKLSRQIAAMGSAVGLSIRQLVDTLADIAAFDTVVPECVKRLAGANMKVGFGQKVAEGDVLVYPVSTIIKQQTRSMAVSATVTTIVRAPFETLAHAMNPAHWACSSDIIRESNYIDDIFTLQPSNRSRATPSERQVRGLLDEKVKISWDESETQQAQYHNVLNTSFSVRKSKGEADVDYNLCRSIKSTILWDRGPGGLFLDQGYIKLRKLGDNIWRVTMHKEVLFGDATGSGALTGPRDLGQLISYLAPVALTYWLESEIYSLADPHPNEEAQELSDRRQQKVYRKVEKFGQLLESLEHETASRRDGDGQQS